MCRLGMPWGKLSLPGRMGQSRGGIGWGVVGEGWVKSGGSGRGEEAHSCDEAEAAEDVDGAGRGGDAEPE